MIYDNYEEDTSREAVKIGEDANSEIWVIPIVDEEGYKSTYLKYVEKGDWVVEEYPIFYEDWEQDIEEKLDPPVYWIVEERIDTLVQNLLVNEGIEVEEWTSCNGDSHQYRLHGRESTRDFVEDMFEDCTIREGYF